MTEILDKSHPEIIKGRRDKLISFHIYGLVYKIYISAAAIEEFDVRLKQKYAHFLIEDGKLFMYFDDDCCLGYELFQNNANNKRAIEIRNKSLFLLLQNRVGIKHGDKFILKKYDKKLIEVVR